MSGTDTLAGLRANETAIEMTIDDLKKRHPDAVANHWPEPARAAVFAAYADLRDVRAAIARLEDDAARAIVRANTATAIAAGDVFTVANGYARGARPTIRVRPMLASEAKTLGYGQHVNVLDDTAQTMRRAKINGNPKTWKRTPGRVEIPLKYGMYTTWRDRATRGTDDAPAMASIVVDIDADGALTATV